MQHQQIQLAFMGLGTWEIIGILAVVVILFGASRIPQLGSSLGEGIRNFRRSLKGEDNIDVTPEKKLPEDDSKKN